MSQTGHHIAGVLLLALAACDGSTADEPEPQEPQEPEEVTVYATDSPEGACLAAVAERAEGATLQVTVPGTDAVGVTADGALWTCRMSADGGVAALLPPAGHR